MTFRRPGAWGLVLLVLVVAVGGYKALQILTRRPTVKPTAVAAAAVVSVQPATMRPLESTLSVSGTVAARDLLDVAAEAGGLKIESVLVEEGDRVARGQVLARLNSSLLEAQRHQLQARLASSQAQISKAIQPNRPQDIAALESAYHQARATVEQEQANLKQAEASLDNAKKNVERYRSSLSQGFVTVQETETRITEFERQQALVQAARERVQAARFAADQAHQRFDLARVGGRPEDVEIARATRQEIGANLEQVEAQLAQTEIVAPDEGLIVKREAHIGDVSSPGKVLFKMVRRNQLEVRAEVAAAELPRLRAGQNVEFQFNDKPIRGKIWQVSPLVDPNTRLGVARVAVPLESGLKPGMFVGGDIQLGNHQVLAIPSRAVSGDAGKSYVFVVKAQVVSRREVVTGQRQGEWVEIRSGLQPSESVVVDGAGFLADGDRVEIK